MTNSEKTLTKLEQAYNANLEEIRNLEFKIKSLNGADIELKLTGSLAFSVIPWMFSVFSTESLYEWGTIPADHLLLLQATIPAAIGISTFNIFLHKNKIKERLRTFTAAHTQQEVVLERAGYEAEKYVLEKINEVIKRAYKQIESRSNLINNLSTTYDINYKVASHNQPSEAQLTIFKQNYQEKISHLKVSATRYYLHDKYYKQRDKLSRVMDNFLYPTITAAASLMFFGAPSIIYRQLGNIPSLTLQLELLGIPIATTIITTLYIYYRNKTLKKAFANINNTLGASQLSPRATEEEHQELTTALEQAIIDATNALVILEDTKSVYETITGKLIDESVEPATLAISYPEDEFGDKSVVPSPTQETPKKLQKKYIYQGKEQYE